ncbi:ABC transporter ATP-binding protein [Streptomyces luteolifulvus]|uniref:ABC transporter ATP-binding protein n=1 Tax=Streptomyces luteolifulvus TaxID=2615112 RepID=A0A6H9UP78_9ACTN|nr:ABC transporter ATP-binding protein [Streptomyces luteolifulvus]KAB1139635.1 ABC transporter ATP-binding protein [Streptomyces luteolifulvus]
MPEAIKGRQHDRQATGPAAATLLEARNIAKCFSHPNGTVTPAIGDIALSLAKGEFVAIVGPSGCGKTTLLRCLCGLLKPDSGTLSYAGKPVSDVPEDVAVVFQEYNRSLFPWLSVRRNVEFGLNKLSKTERRARAEEALTRVHLTDVIEHYPWQLSGGMQQRVAIARAVATQPNLLLMDEPFASVDAQTRIRLETMTASISTELGLATLLITHDIDEAVFLADRVIVLSPRPSSVLAEVVVDIPRPRTELEVKAMPRFQEYRRLIHDLIVAKQSDTPDVVDTPAPDGTEPERSP